MENKKIIYIPVGISGSGKSTFFRENFVLNDIVSSDHCREIVSGDELNQDSSRDAFELFHFIIEKKMKWNQVVVADATNLSSKARKKLLDLAHKFGYTTAIVIMDISLAECLERNKVREKPRPEHVLSKQFDSFQNSKNVIINVQSFSVVYNQLWIKSGDSDPKNILNGDNEQQWKDRIW